MNKNNYEITIIGLGNIGLRYLEGILKIRYVKTINLIEKDLHFLEKKLLNFSTKDRIIYKEELITNRIINSDLIIVSTPSKERFEVCEKLINVGYLGDLLLEKFLFPNLNTLEKAENLFKTYPSKIYVNQWMRKTFISNILNQKDINTISIQGDNLGLLCNSVHFIDLVIERLKINDFKIDSQKSQIKKIFKTKRKGYTDICGRLGWISDFNKLQFSLEDHALGGDSRNIKFSIKSNFKNNEYVLCKDYLINLSSKEKYKIPYLSEHSKDTIIKILNKDDPVIPNFNRSLTHHKLLFNSLFSILDLEDYQKIIIT